MCHNVTWWQYWQSNKLHRFTGCGFDSWLGTTVSVSYTHLTLPTNREVQISEFVKQ